MVNLREIANAPFASPMLFRNPPAARASDPQTGEPVRKFRTSRIPADLHFSGRFLWINEIIGVRAGGSPWLLSLNM